MKPKRFGNYLSYRYVILKIDNGKCWGLYTAYGSGGVQSTAPNWRYPYTTE